MLSWRTSYKAGNFIIIIIITIIITVVLLRHHEAEDAGNTILRNVGKHLTLRRLMSYIYGAPILDVSRSHTTTQHSR